MNGNWEMVESRGENKTDLVKDRQEQQEQLTYEVRRRGLEERQQDGIRSKLLRVPTMKGRDEKHGDGHAMGGTYDGDGGHPHLHIEWIGRRWARCADRGRGATELS